MYYPFLSPYPPLLFITPSSPHIPLFLFITPSSPHIPLFLFITPSSPHIPLFYLLPLPLPISPSSIYYPFLSPYPLLLFITPSSPHIPFFYLLPLPLHENTICWPFWQINRLFIVFVTNIFTRTCSCYDPSINATHVKHSIFWNKSHGI